MTDFDAVFCTHEQMTECHPGCGHFRCPCGVSWDDGFMPFFDDTPMFDDEPISDAA